MNKLFRSFPKSYPRMEWVNNTKNNYTNCHWGQRKLFFSELEFFSMCAKHTDLSNCCVLYVGAASGTHTNLLIEMFPEINWILYDPNKFDIRKDYPNVDIHTKKDGFFTDDKIKDVLNNKLLGSRKLLFICDMRLESTEEQIYKEMITQQRWIIKLGAFMYILKMRVPYDHLKDHSYDITDIKDKIINYDEIVKEFGIGKFPYLKGKLVTQVWAPLWSAEMRLIGKSYNNMYKMQMFDTKEYEETALYFNEVDRLKDNYIYGKSKKVKKHLLFYDDSYKKVTEYYIVRKYLKDVRKVNSFDETIKEMYMIEKEISRLTVRDFYGCIKWTIDKCIREEPDISNEMLKQKISVFYGSMKNKLIKQIKDIEHSKNNKPILEINQYDEQIKKGKTLINSLSKPS